MQIGASSSEQVRTGALGAALEREHREIDAGIDAFRTSSAGGETGPDGALASLRRAMDALRRHIYLEEEFLFPPMRAEFAIPMGVMLREHGEIWRTLDALEAKLSESDDRASMLSVCDELAEQLERHNSKEEPIFYTQADRSLGTEESTELKDFLQSGQMPPGWICQATRS
jgi:regulator of cell morphogenesis and NO signaling